MAISVKQVQNLGYEVLDIGSVEGLFDPQDIVFSPEGEPVYLGPEDCFFETEEAFSGLNISGKSDYVCAGERRYLLGTSVYRDANVTLSPIFRNNSWIDKKISAVSDRIVEVVGRFESVGMSVFADVEQVVEGVSKAFNPPPPSIYLEESLGDIFEDEGRRRKGVDTFPKLIVEEPVIRLKEEPLILHDLNRVKPDLTPSPPFQIDRNPGWDKRYRGLNPNGTPKSRFDRWH